MLRVAALVLLSLFGIASDAGAQAQQVLGRAFTQRAGTSYTGPGDIVSGATAACSLQAYSAAIAAAGTQNIVDLRRASDNAICTANIATNGSVDLTVGTPCNGNTQTVTAWIGASSAAVSQCYDQTGNGNHTAQATAANQPTLVLNAIGSLPVMQTVAAVQGLVKTSYVPATGVMTLVAVAARTSGSGLIQFIRAAGGSSNNAIFAHNSSANHFLFFSGGSGSISATATDPTFHSAIGVMNGASSAFVIDGAATTGTMTGSTTSGSIVVAGGAASTTGQEGEAIIYDNVAFSSAQYAAMQANQKVRWSTP